MSEAEGPAHRRGRKAAIPANMKFTKTSADARNINWIPPKTGATMKTPNDGLLSLQWFLSVVCVMRKIPGKKMAWPNIQAAGK